jgi:hypothetical protein
MARTVALILFAVVLVAIGWIAGVKAKSSSPDFALIVNAPGGETTVECVRGCKLAWVERGLNPNQTTDTKIHLRMWRGTLPVRQSWELDQPLASPREPRNCSCSVRRT